MSTERTGVATSTRPGDTLAGRYRLIDLLSESGGGRFWRAHDRVLERHVALHVIAEDDPRAPGLLEAARTSATVLDSRILRVLDAEARDGRCYVVNEWGTGTSLDILVTHGGPLGPRRSAWLVAEVAGAIATAHNRGVAHGRLNPENVLIDRLGAIRLIGLCVDAALHGLPAGRLEQDRQDLGGLLYCSLTGTWPGPSGSAVPGAPHEHGSVLPPRRVRAGVPRPLDQLWSAIADGNHRRRWHTHHDVDVSTAGAVGERLLEFVGDPAGLPAALAASIPPINEIRPVVLPAVPELSVRDARPADDDEPAPAQVDEVDEVEQAAQVDESVDVEERTDVVPSDQRRIPTVAELPTEAGMPVWDDEDDDDVAWLRARSTPPPPPPPFEDPPERPLFAPEPTNGEPSRRPRDDVPPLKPGDTSLAAAGFWPWEPGTGSNSLVTTAESEPVPGRNWLRLAMVLAAALMLLVAVVVAFNLGRGRTPLGQERDDPAPSPTLTTPAEPSATPISGLVATDLDPLGTDEENTENPDQAPLAVDGDPATAWSTVTYNDQFGPPPGLKTGVGLVVDLGTVREVAAVDLTLVGAPTTVELYVGDDSPTEAPTGDPVAADTATGTKLALEPIDPDDEDSTVTGRYLLVWFTSLPEVADGFQAGLAEVIVRGR